MANTRRQQDGDEITFAEPPYIALADSEPLQRPGLPHQTVDVARAKEVARQAAVPPIQQPRFPIQQAPRPAIENYVIVDLETPEPPRVDKENYWKHPHLLFRFWRRRRNQQTSASVSDSRFDAAWRSVRLRLSGGSSIIGRSLSSDRQQSSSVIATGSATQASEPAEVAGVDEIGTTNPEARETLPVNEVNTLLAHHRSKISAGHEGQLRSMH
jgi:hypothetical protein